MADVKDQNRERKLESIRILQQLHHVAEDRGFSGTVQVQITAHGGRLGKIRSRYERYDPPDCT